ncbi:MAG: hypothetical protein AB7O71_25115, partial [Hyphomicrobiaceae bacterium]
MNRQDEKLTLARFESLLDAYGGDFSRWPERFVPEAHALIGSSSAANRLHAEARALDRLLAKASAPDPARLEKLAQRIIAAAEREGAVVSAERGRPAEAGAGARIIRMPAAGRMAAGRKTAETQNVPVRPVSRPSTGKWFGGGNWPAAAALAASLTFGFAIGLTDVASTTAYNVASFVQPSSDTEIVLSELQLDTFNGL